MIVMAGGGLFLSYVELDRNILQNFDMTVVATNTVDIQTGQYLALVEFVQ